MSKRNKTVDTTPATDATTQTAEPAAPVTLVAFSAKGKTHQFRTGSQRAIWYASLQSYEGKPLAEWLAHVAKAIPAQRVKADHKSPHKGGAGFLRRYGLLGLLAGAAATEATEGEGEGAE
jgi:hypothetical protein